MSCVPRVLVLLSLLLGPSALAWGFVERLSPTGGPIPCHQFKAAIFLYIQGVYTAPQLGAALEAHYLTPLGLSWSSADTTDNTNLIGLITGITHADPVVQQAARESVGHRMESLCAAWEHDFPTVDTPNEFRALLGIPTQ